MPWMKRWAGPFPVVADKAVGGSIVDIDDNVYVDFCLGDTGSMTGHAIAPISRAIADQAQRGFTTMLPSSDLFWVAGHLSERFGMSKWQFCLSATDANRFSLRLARQLTGKPKIVVNDWCYHGTHECRSGHVRAESSTVTGRVQPLTILVIGWSSYAMDEEVGRPIPSGRRQSSGWEHR